MSGPALVQNGNQPQALNAAQLEQLTAITSMAKGSGFLEGKNGGKGFMGSFVDSVTGQKHYIKMLTHRGERTDALGDNADEANLLSSQRLGEMSDSLKDDLLKLAKTVGKEDAVKDLFDSRKGDFKDLVSRKIATQAVRIIKDAHNKLSGANGVRFDWDAVASAGKGGDTTLGNTLLMKERKQLERIEKEIGTCDESLQSSRVEKKALVGWINDHEKIKNCDDALKAARIKKNEFLNGIDSLSTKKYDILKGLQDCDNEIRKCKDALQSALKSTGIKYNKYQEDMNEYRGKVDELRELNSKIDSLECKRDGLLDYSIDLKNGFEKVEKGVITVDEMVQELEATNLSRIMDNADASKNEKDFFIESMRKGIVPRGLSNLDKVLFDSSRIPKGLWNAQGTKVLDLRKELMCKCVAEHLSSQSKKAEFNLHNCGLVDLWSEASKVAEDVFANRQSMPKNGKELQEKFNSEFEKRLNKPIDGSAKEEKSSNSGLSPLRRRQKIVETEEKIVELKDMITSCELDIKDAEGTAQGLSFSIKNLYSSGDKTGELLKGNLKKVNAKIEELTRERNELEKNLNGLTMELWLLNNPPEQKVNNGQSPDKS